MPLPRFRQRVLVTGASAGLGQEMARHWARQGRDLALCARRVDELERLRDELLAVTPAITVSLHPLDVTDHEAVDAAFADAAAALGGLDRVVVNAGVAGGGSLGLDQAAANRTTALTNFVGAVHQAEAALRLFRPAGAGHLVFISSMSALRGMGGSMNVYSATKAGVSALAEGARSDLAGTGVAVTAVHPGYVRTSMASHFPRMLMASDPERATRAIVAAVEREPATAYVPALPWALAAWPMRLVPLGLYRRIAG
ncbi:Short-chain dehydrogenase [Friedmanniella luteola]|uniref:Short-chain dehydrogenase n=1 Tax=Friedmanniella luteola TaxID=546871 RepID=A0A1H1L3C2_9ACTN|nr:SDR family oxidoreductase [Friedmanniella luteola]SDR68535.1 Short-chain dehydrogenase [Friedmanniella luteola]